MGAGFLHQLGNNLNIRCCLLERTGTAPKDRAAVNGTRALRVDRLGGRSVRLFRLCACSRSFHCSDSRMRCCSSKWHLYLHKEITQKYFCWTLLKSGSLSLYTRWFKYDRDWFVCKQAALHSCCAVRLVYIQISPGHICTTLYNTLPLVHSCQQKSIGLKFSKSQTGSDVRYNGHHNSSRFTFPIFAHSCRFSVLHSLHSITPRIY